MAVELYPHQQKAVDEMHNGCILWGGVGTGKTITSLVYYYTKVCGGVTGDMGSMRHPKNLIVITTAKKRDSLDWEEDAMLLGLGVDPDCNPGAVTITVDSWNNISKYEEIEDAFFIFDEQRLVGAGAWTKSFIHIAKYNQWILLSATPGDTWIDYIPVFVANGFYKNRTEFKREHVVYNTYSKFPKVDHYVGLGKLTKYKNALLVHMPYTRHTIRHEHILEMDYDHDMMEEVMTKRWHVYENRPLRDVSELFAVMRKVVNSDSSRLEAIRGLMKIHPRLIVFYNFDYELEQLRTLSQEPSFLYPADSTVLMTYSMTPTSSVGSSERCSSCSATRSACRCGGQLSMETASSGSTSQRSMSHGSFDPSTLSGSVETSEESEEDYLDRKYSTVPFSSVPLDSHRLSSETTSSSTPPRTISTVSKSGTSSGAKPTRKALNGNPTLTGGVKTSSPTSPQTPMTDLMSSVSTSGSVGNHSSTNGPTTTPTTAATPIVSTSVEVLESHGPVPDFSHSYDEDSTFAVAEWNGHKHQPIPTTDRWVYLVQYVAGAEGWNCIETNAVCLYSQNYSYKVTEQTKGRIDRLNTPFIDLHYYILRSKAMIDVAIGRALRDKKSFNEGDLSGRFS